MSPVHSTLLTPETLPHPTPIPPVSPEALSVAEPYGLQAGGDSPQGFLGLSLSFPSQVLVTIGLSSHHRLSHTPPGSAQAEASHGSLCSFYQIALDQFQAATNLGLNKSPFQEASEPAHQVAGFKP